MSGVRKERRETWQAQPSADRRGYQRVKVSLAGRYMLCDRREFDCRTINMSPNGVLLIAPERGELGSRVVAYLEEIGRIEGSVARHTVRGFAMRLDATKTKRARLAEQLTWLANRTVLGIPEDRRHERVAPHRLRTSLTMPDGSRRWAIIVDLSRSGVAVKTDSPPPIGAAVVVGRTPGRVIRAFAGGVAIEFLRLIPADRFDDEIVL